MLEALDEEQTVVSFQRQVEIELNLAFTCLITGGISETSGYDKWDLWKL
jgi:hypothetical protein